MRLAEKFRVRCGGKREGRSIRTRPPLNSTMNDTHSESTQTEIDFPAPVNTDRQPIAALPLRHEFTPEQIKRFWSRVKIIPETQCWEWQHIISEPGYGMFSWKRRTLRAHRISFMLANDRDPKGLVCHQCDNRKCVNPAHLFEGSNDDNMKDAKSKGRMSHGTQHSAALLTEKRPRRDRHPGATVTQEVFQRINDLRKQGMNQRQIAKVVGVSQGTAWKVFSGRHWRSEQ